MKSYYNEFSKFPAESISDVQPDDLAGFQQFHAFAGVAGWSIALREAGWPEEVPVWSGSCPCQPFSAAGLGKGTADDRHLWPEFLRLITGPANGSWRTADWLFCRDNKWRPVKPGSSPLAHGLPGRTSKVRTWIRLMGFGPKVAEKVFRMSKGIIQEARSSRNGQLAGYGNAIVIPQAVEFIRACMEELEQ